mgnify:CR=1 FL=1
MNEFSAVMVIIGIVLLIISLFLIVSDRKKVLSHLRRMDEKKAELVGIINDAEQMIEELNKFSDYIVTQMDLKNEEIWNNMKMIEEKAKQYENRINGIKESEASENNFCKAANFDDNISADAEYKKKSFEPGSDLVIDTLSYAYNESPQYINRNSRQIPGEKVIPLNSKYRDVLRLAEKGMSSMEIAKKLNMGKGEIQLVLELNK